MKCELPDCAERFNATEKSEYGTLWYTPNMFIYDAYENRRRKVKICKKCIHRPLKEVFESLIHRSLSETEIESIQDANITVDLEKSVADQAWL